VAADGAVVEPAVWRDAGAESGNAGAAK
jgi:hypothetical protein